jgi:hypothetical protein
MTIPGRRPHRVASALTLLSALAIGAVAVVTASPAAAQQPSPAAAGRRPASARPMFVPRPLTPGAASAQARATGRGVLVTALTTPASATTANPDGTFTVRETLQPTRAWHDDSWASLDPSLRRDPDGTISPEVTTSALVLSGGGTKPLAVMTVHRQSLSLSWPGALPVPRLSGATATYAGVLPGVNLVVTATAQGGFSDVLVVTSAAAAADPRLAHLRLTTASTGLRLSVSKTGVITATPGPRWAPVITAAAPRMWDSAAPPSRLVTRAGPGRGTLVTKTGLPAYSTVTAPGAAANASAVPVTVSGGEITLAPPAAALAGRRVVYPVYIDPTWTPVTAKASNWTEVSEAYPGQSYWRESSELQVGLCPADLPGGFQCGSVTVTRSLFTMPMPSQLTSDTVVDTVDLYMTNVWAPSCGATNAELWHTGTISSATTWNNQPSWSSDLQEQAFAYGWDATCGYSPGDVTWDSSALTSLIQAAATGGSNTETFGVRAADETNENQWKQFLSGSSNITMTITYADPPNQPTDLATDPGGTCQTNSSTPALIGNDDVTFDAYVSDNTQDNPLTTEFVIYNSSGSQVYNSNSQGTSVKTGSGTAAGLTLTRSQMEDLQTGGKTTPFTYHWYAVATNDDSLTSPQSQTCYFTYNPNGPQVPDVTLPSSGTLGQQVAAQFTQPPGCSPTGYACPVTYTYQVGVSPPVTVKVPTGGVWKGDITVTRLGPLMVSVYGTAAGGNPGQAATPTIIGTAPDPAYQDGYYTGPGHPDLLTVGTGATPSLWLSEGTGNGTVGPPEDIGSLGTGINPGDNGPADWAGAIVLHGDFTGDDVQDVMAYYPSGSHDGYVIASLGDASTLVSDPDNVSVATSANLDNQTSLNALEDPGDLVAAGNASQIGVGTTQIGTGADDLIGIAPDPSGYELDLYTNGTCPSCASAGDYAFNQTLSTVAPDPSDPDWDDYTLATAQPGGNPSDVVLFALDNTTGTLWESVNPNAGNAQSGDTTIVGTGNWSPVATNWETSPPTLLQADINSSGATELWTRTVQPGHAPTFTAYTVSGSAQSGYALTTENVQTYEAPTADWPLTDGSPYAQGGLDTTATETIAGNNAVLAPMNSGWGDDDNFSTDIGLSNDGLGDSGGYLAVPANTIPNDAGLPEISLWFKTVTAGQIIFSVQEDPLDYPNPTSGGYDPVLYIGTDGTLHGEWWNGNVGPIVSSAVVDDGLWHQVTLTSCGTAQSLYLDGNLVGSSAGKVSVSNTPYAYLGAGSIGGKWPDENYYEKQGNDGYPEYFDGQLAAVDYSTSTTACYPPASTSPPRYGKTFPGRTKGSR